MCHNHFYLGLVVAGALVISAEAPGQCRTIDFEDLPAGTEVSDQYDGVDFFAWPGSCGGFGSVMPTLG